jgi:predicted pyridoxine 5'-phosphate oxidase superfamily flavin-nucleotide-binding protein
MEARGGFHDRVTDDLAAFLAGVDTAYLATANASGQPYVQHRGGPKGFIRVIDDRTIGFADFAGNRQYITTGNLAENAKAFLFLMDYAHRQRVKLWAHARVIDDDPNLVARLMPHGYAARGEQAILFKIEAWDAIVPGTSRARSTLQMSPTPSPGSGCASPSSRPKTPSSGHGWENDHEPRPLPSLPHLRASFAHRSASAASQMYRNAEWRPEYYDPSRTMID